MNLLFFLTPKSQVACLSISDTLRQAVEKMEHHRYSVVPVLDEQGRYHHSISEGDLLHHLKKHREEEWESIGLKDITPYRPIEPVSVNASMEDLYEKILVANFVPVVDDKGVFIGLVTRRAVLEYLLKR